MASNTFLLSHYFQAPQITARDILEDAESEFRDYGQHMVEYVGLNAFVRNPVFHGGEEIKFDRNTGFCRLQLADHASQFLTDLREAFQIIDQVGAKHLYSFADGRLRGWNHRSGAPRYRRSVLFLSRRYSLSARRFCGIWLTSQAYRNSRCSYRY